MQNDLSRTMGIIPIFRSLGVGVHYDIDNTFLRKGDFGVTYLIPREHDIEYQVVLRKDMPISLSRKTLAHELGHIVMGHLLKAHLQNDLGTKRNEYEAEEFASFILPYIYRQPSEYNGAAI